jgi:hypothetical protein
MKTVPNLALLLHVYGWSRCTGLYQEASGWHASSTYNTTNSASLSKKSHDESPLQFLLHGILQEQTKELPG